jgi:ParB family chromosome partitioning protein
MIRISDIKIGKRLRKNPGDVSSLAKSIANEKLLHPIVIDEDNKLIAGFRRIKAYEFLGRTEIPCRRIGVKNALQAEYDENAERANFTLEDIKAIYDEVKASRVGHRESREKAQPQVTRTSNAAAKGDKDVIEKLGKLPSLFPKGPSDAVTGRIVGHSEQNVNKIVKIVTAAEKHPEAKEILDQVNKGEIRLEVGYKRAQCIIDAHKPKLSAEQWGKKLQGKNNDIEHFDEFGKEELKNLKPRIYNVWSFKYADSRLGRIPGQVAMNVLYYYSKPNDLVIDPMCITGSTIDACQIMGRRCIAFGNVNNPARNDIKKWDTINSGLPPEARGCVLIFLEPVFYWKLQDGTFYSKDNNNLDSSDSIVISATHLPEFMKFMKKIASDCYEMLKMGGHVALVLQAFHDKETDEFQDLPMDCGKLFEDVGFGDLLERIELLDIPQEAMNQSEVELTKRLLLYDKQKGAGASRLLSVSRDLMIFKKERRQVEGENETLIL